SSRATTRTSRRSSARSSPRRACSGPARRWCSRAGSGRASPSFSRADGAGWLLPDPVERMGRLVLGGELEQEAIRAAAGRQVCPDRQAVRRPAGGKGDSGRTGDVLQWGERDPVRDPLQVVLEGQIGVHVPYLRRLAGDHRVEIDVELPEPAVEGPPRPLEPEQVERERVETPLGHAGEAGGERVEEARVEV